MSSATSARRGVANRPVVYAIVRRRDVSNIRVLGSVARTEADDASDPRVHSRIRSQTSATISSEIRRNRDPPVLTARRAPTCPGAEVTRVGPGALRTRDGATIGL
ncbi:hypothetical protein [Parafrankia sp. EUN1f]|uniref:hypothetical protein n=1 Tax=Parafrankia sp. EUN1f TaxID=102897 RepID=UPI0012F7F419|nr:hypothetical protein [Parafrankia sp. EUN1f]